MMNQFFSDLRFASRTLLKSPGFTLVAVTALALAIGANTAIFSIVNGLLVRPYPFRDPEQLVVLRAYSAERNVAESLSSYPDFLEYRGLREVFADLAAVSVRSFNLSGGAEPMRVGGARVTSNLFSVIGARTVLGRTFASQEDLRGDQRVVVLSHTLWVNSFGSDPRVLGRSVDLDGEPHTVIGVLAPGEQFPDSTVAKLFVPIAGDPTTEQRDVRAYSLLGRLRPGVPVARAQAVVASTAGRLEKDYPESSGWSARVLTLRDHLTGHLRSLLVILLGVVAFVLLIACANVANLLLQRASGRQREIAVRAALGAGRLRLVRQLLTESLLLSLLGSLLGVLLAHWLIRLLLSMTPVEVPDFVRDFGIDGTVLGFVLLVSAVTAVFFGLVPALSASRPDLARIFSEGSRSSGSPRRRLLFKALVVAEVTVSLVLVVGAGLMIRSFERLQQVKPGFEPDGLLGVALTLPDFKYREPQERLAFYRRVLEHLESLPGVESAAAGTHLPIAPWARSAVALEGQPPEDERRNPLVGVQFVSAGYFETLQQPVVRGRGITPQDGPGAIQAVVVSAAAARQLWPGEDPLGKRLRLGMIPNGDVRTVVGVVDNVRRQGQIRDPGLDVYVPYEQVISQSLYVFLRAQKDPASLMPTVRRELHALDPDLPLEDLETLNGALERAVWPQRLSSFLFSLFAVVALVLAASGLYGSMAYSVAQRTREIGVRMAMGAHARDVLLMVVRQGLSLLTAGLVLGLLGAFALTRVLQSLLFEVASTDPGTFVVSVTLMLAVALLASYLPARRAARVDPVTALRAE